jgi:hypothetical protein
LQLPRRTLWHDKKSLYIFEPVEKHTQSRMTAGRLISRWSGLCGVFLCFLNPGLYAQGEIGLITGLSNYQGDLASYRLSGGLKVLVGPVIGIHTGYEFNQRFQARADLLYTRISGDDDLSTNPSSQLRNLDFFAPVIQISVGMDWNVLGLSQDEASSFTPFGSVGAGMFYFNPRTIYQGEKVSLQPLGTEGQFLEDYPDQKPYTRFQPCLQFGGGLKWVPQEGLQLSLEGMLSYTFTDYLDDASTIYITYPELLEKAGPLTAALANRQGEFLGTEPVVVETGAARANSATKDLFGVMTLRASIPINIDNENFKVRRHNNKTIKDPKF